ncbi:MAG: hypothetical protein ABL989_15045 [Gammaproteobacteria bacterium]
MSASFDGDLIRPLGLVTLYFGYVEAEVNALVAQLQARGVPIEIPLAAPLGQRLAEFGAVIQGLQNAGASEVLGLLEESRLLIDRRNSLVHASILAKGRVTPNDPSKPEYSVTPDELSALAEEAFHWKERLNAAVQLRLLPTLREQA